MKITLQILAFAAGLALSSITGCQSLGAVFSNPAIVQDVVGGVVAILEQTGTSEASINQAAVKAQANAQKATLTIAALEATLEALPSFGPAVAQWMGENPELAQTTTDVNTWLAALVTATTPGTTAQANVKFRIRKAASHIQRTLPAQVPIVPANMIIRVRQRTADGGYFYFDPVSRLLREPPAGSSEESSAVP